MSQELSRDQKVQVIAIITGLTDKPEELKKLRRLAAERLEAKFAKLPKDDVLAAVLLLSEQPQPVAPVAPATATETTPKAEKAPEVAPNGPAGVLASHDAKAKADPALTQPIVKVTKEKGKTTTTINAGGDILVDVVEKHEVKKPEKVAGASVRQWPAGKLPYKLEKSERPPELLTKDEWFARNSARSDGRKWLAVPDADPDVVVTPKPIKVGKERTDALAEGSRKDREFETNREKALLRKQEEVEAHESKKGEGKTDSGRVRLNDGKKEPVKKGSVEKSTRPEWEGMGMCALIRYMASANFAKDDIMVAAKKAGFDPNPATISIQSKKGKNGDGVPKLTPEIAKKVKALTK